MVWNPAAGPEALLLPGAFSGLAAGPGDVLFEPGSATRLSLLDGTEDGRLSEECGKAGPLRSVSWGPSLQGARDRPIVGLIPPDPGRADRRGGGRASRGADGGTVIEFGGGSGSECTVAYRETAPEWTVDDAQASRDVLVVTELGTKGANRAIFRHRSDGKDYVVAIDLMRVEMAGDTVVFWSPHAGRILLASTRDPTPTPRPLTLFGQLPVGEPCIDVEASAGRFILFRNECLSQKDGGTGVVERVLFDATAQRAVAKLEGIAGPVGVTPDGKMIAAGPDGICPVRGV
jgi:hypothetical protein